MELVARQEVIDRLRARLLELVEEEHSLCAVAARKGIFCHGFQRFTESEIRDAFPWIARPRANWSRDELEDVIDRYLVARKEALEQPLTCDALEIDQDLCMGWSTWSDQELAGFHRDLLGEEVQIVADSANSLAHGSHPSSAL